MSTANPDDGMKQADIPELIETLLGDDDWAAIDAAEMLGAMRAKEAVPALIQTLHAEDWYRYYHELMGRARRAGNWGAAVGIAEHLGTSIHDLQIKSAEALARIGDRRAVPELIAIVQDEDIIMDVRCAAMIALGRLKAEEAVPILASLLTSDKGTIIVVAEKSLEYIGSPEALEAVRKWRESR